MKKLTLFIITLALFATACSPGGSDTADAVDKAEAMNEENFEKEQKVEDANFVANFVNQSMYITNLTNAYLATADPEGKLEKAINAIMEDHAELMDIAKGLAGKYKITIPGEMGLAKQTDIDGFVEDTAVEASMKSEYVTRIKDTYDEMISNADDIMEKTNNEQIRGFAEKVKEQAQSHLETLKPETEQLSSR